MPRWVFELTPAWLQAARTVVRRVRVRLILDLNLITDTPSAALVWARAARSDLPGRSIAGFEIGNEPDIYSRGFWVAALSRRGLDASILPRDLTPAGYAGSFAPTHACCSALRPMSRCSDRRSQPVAPRGLGLEPRRAHARDLGTVTAHRYPYTACAAPASPNHPTIQRLLSEHASAGTAGSLARW